MPYPRKCTPEDRAQRNREFSIRITAQAVMMLMQTRWIPEDHPEHRVKLVGITEPDEDGFVLPLLVSENA